MNILHVNKDFSGTGAQRVSFELLAGTPANARYYCGDLRGQRNESFVRDLERIGVQPVFVLGLSNRTALLLPIAVLHLAWLIRTQHIGLVHSHSFVAGIAARVASALTRTPCIHTFHGAPSRTYSLVQFLVCRLVERLLFHLSYAVVFNSDHQLRLIAPPSAHSALVIHNFVPRGKATLRNPRNHRRRVLFIGRLEFQKHPEFFVQLAARFKNSGYSFRLVGSGSLAEVVRDTNTLLQARVDICGFAEDPRPHFAWADCVVVCSRYESFSLVIGEALQAGCEVVCSRVDGLDGIWGASVHFFEEGSLDDAVAALSRATVHGVEVGDRLAALERLNIERFLAAHLELYSTAVPDWTPAPSPQHSSGDGPLEGAA